MQRKQLYQKAQQATQRRRQIAETEAEKRRGELFAAHPQLLQLEQTITETGSKAALLAALGSKKEADDLLAKVDRLAVEKTDILVALGRPKDALDVNYSCKICSDKGIVEGAVCSCVHQEVKQMRMQEINQSGPLRLCKFESFKLDAYPQQMEYGGTVVRPREIMQAVYERCVRWADSFGPRSQSLYMFGDAGLGKTHLALSIASVVIEKGYDVIYVSAPSVFDEIRNNPDATGLYQSMLNAQLLVLDDLGVEFLDARVRSMIYDLVNTRMGRRPTIYTTNITSQELLERRYDEKVASRLLGSCELIRVFGKDIRLQKQ